MGSLALAALVRPHLDLRSRYGQTMPNPRPYTLLSTAKPSAFHWPRQPLPAHISVQVSNRAALNRPHTQPANFTLSHIQSLSSFLSRAPSRHAHNRSPRAFPHAAATRRNAVHRFLPSSLRSHRKGLVHFFSKRCRVRCNRRLSTQARRRTFPTAHHVADHIQPHNQAQYGQQCCLPTVRGRAATQAFSFRYLVSPCRRSDVPQPQHTKARRLPRTQPHKPTLSTRPTPLATLPSPAPNHPPVDEVGALRA